MDLYHPCGFAVRLEDLPDYFGVVTILRLYLCVASVLRMDRNDRRIGFPASTTYAG